MPNWNVKQPKAVYRKMFGKRILLSEINPHPTALSSQARASWRLPASEGVERLLALLQPAPDGSNLFQ